MTLQKGNDTAHTADETVQRTDCRVYRNFIKLHFLYISTAFKSVKIDHYINLQTSILFRAKQLYQLNNSKTLQKRYSLDP